MSHSNIDSHLCTVPVALRDELAAHWTAFTEMLADSHTTRSIDSALLPELCRVWACSDFVARHCVRDPSLLLGLLDSGDLHQAYAADTLAGCVQAALAGCVNADQLGVALRRLRRREMLRIAWRDIAGHADLRQTSADLSALAEACIRGALIHLQGWLEAKWGVPTGANSGQPQQLVVLGMGKLGAHELNFSSDIDLIFAYPENGETQGVPRTRSNEEFFVRLGRELIRALDEKTAEGFVFRVDMRLRPFGGSGALALSFGAMENYYQVHGRDWERYALIKARSVAGCLEDSEHLLDLLRPFIYRRYLDYGAFAALREMKAMVAAEVQRKGMADNVKLGAGGIREVEFIGQAFQLIRGGREPALQRREIRRVLAWLAEQDYLPRYVVKQLLDAYVFLRDSEHRLQEYRDQQTHRLPTDETARQRLAYSMGCETWDDFIPVLRGHMARVHSHFEQVFEAPQTGDGKAALDALWQGMLDNDAAQAALREAGFDDTEAVLRQVTVLRDSSRYRALHHTGRERLDRLMPLLLGAAGAHDEADVVVQRLLKLVEAVARRSAYLALLVEHPLALSQLVRLCAVSPWIAVRLVQYPLLLDELLDARSLYAPASRDELAAELQCRLDAVPDGDLEQAMDALRQFKQAAVLRVAAADVMDAVPLMVVSDHLTYIAEVILEQVLELAWADLTRRYGRPSVADDSTSEEKGFAIVAYGKLGGIELGYGSDLDMVFLHTSNDATPVSHAVTAGPKVVADAVFYARLGQRIIHILTTLTPAGTLYDVDMRLRPSGASGLLVVGLPGFEDYQKNKAWVWEHQALVRARVVAGDEAVGAAFRRVRREVLTHEGDPLLLRKEVREMRERMRDNLSRESTTRFDLKQGRGGIADIEFMVQFGALRWAHQAPDLTDFTDSIRLLASLAAHGFFAPEESEILSDAYRAYRTEVHRLSLQERPALVDDNRFREQREAVMQLWRKYLED
ncbi:MAG: bifunctional [glutamate--ammonia ligase]-adenylyl-L-tyrosine phosphorylase/[glutamate--ammonia-ligase] adenylyltransferase [Gammaproteobacteria bacterium]|nr:bifunctional [glutamate--ammonia ligase]-adenylyl-L-tyrosine phosphorylase/[glutamate--ammonia-ligase] adenylyltransferase [Gammaproteobacteria bacterium]